MKTDTSKGKDAFHRMQCMTSMVTSKRGRIEGRRWGLSALWKGPYRAELGQKQARGKRSKRQSPVPSAQIPVRCRLKVNLVRTVISSLDSLGQLLHLLFSLRDEGL